MNLNIDENVSKLLPWELSMTIGGTAYPTVRPTLGLVARVSGLATLGSAEAIDLVLSLFGDRKPPVAEWDPAVMTLVIGGYLQHFGEHVRKNARRVAELTQAAAPTMTATATATGAAATGAASVPPAGSGQ